MTPIDGFVLGVLSLAILLAIVFLIFLVVRKTLAVANALIEGLREIPKLRASGESLVKVFLELRDEAKLFRAIATGVYVPPTPEGGEETPPQRPAVPSPFPSPAFDRFAVQPEVPDATIEDSKDVTTTDAEQAEIERLETLRTLGFPVEDAEDAEGIHAESE
jgi:hypothetical protein